MYNSKSFSGVKSTQKEKVRFIKENKLKLAQVEVTFILFFFKWSRQQNYFKSYLSLCTFRIKNICIYIYKYWSLTLRAVHVFSGEKIFKC